MSAAKLVKTSLWVAGLFTVAALAACSKRTHLTVLTGGSSGIYYPLGVAMAQIYSDQIENTQATVQATKASVENLNLLEAGRADVGISLADTVADAVAGNQDAGFEKPLAKIRSMGNLHTNYVQIVARADLGINSLHDLKGKRISVGAPKSGTELNARAVFKAAGLRYEDMAAVEFLPYAESVELMKNRQLDATLQSAGLGMAAFRDLAISIPITFVAIPAEVTALIGSPAYQVGEIPAGTYKGQSQALATVKIENVLVTSADIDPELVYQMTKGVYENLDKMKAAHAAGGEITLEKAARDLPAPLHPGAERYFKEKGLLR